MRAAIDPDAGGGDYYGPVVNLASRLADLAVPGELLATVPLAAAASVLTLVAQREGGALQALVRPDRVRHRRRPLRQQRGQDRHSVIADPGFMDAARDDFRLKPDSAALKLGFKPFDYTQTGRRPKPRLTRDLPEVPAAFEGSAK